MKTIIVHHRSPHHAEYSGYGRLVDYLNQDFVVKGHNVLPYRLAKFIAGLNKQQAGLYDSSSVFKELELYKHLGGCKEAQVVHYFNAERDIRWLVKLKRKNDVKYIGTFHKPPFTLKQSITDTSYLKHLDAAICVGENQVDFIKEWLSLNQVIHIPHGVDTHFFSPNASNRSLEPHLLFVGQHLRDFETFNYCIPKIIEHLPQIRVTVVLKKEFADHIVKHKNIKVFSGLDDEALRAKYQAAHILFLPLLDATACNSLLEAMACGLPIITSNVGGVEGYLEGTGNILCDGPEEFINQTVTLLSNKEQQTNIAQASRIKALSYRWEVVAEQVEQFYKTLVS